MNNDKLTQSNTLNALDCISRQAAIDALEREKTYCNAYKEGYSQTDVFEKYNMGLTDGIKAIKGLPSIQPELGKNSPSEQHKMDELEVKTVETCTDIISRQAAIDALGEEPLIWRNTLEEITARTQWRQDREAILSVPSTQPEITLEIAIDYLHKIGWMQEHDRILTESTQKERKKGFWFTLKKGDKGYSAGDFKCSVCGEPNHTWLPRPKFCSNCGAEMSIYEEPVKIKLSIN